MFQASTCMTHPFSGNVAVISSETKKSGRSTKHERPSDRVVLGQRNQRHAAQLAELDPSHRIGVTLRTTEDPGVPLVVPDGSRSMNVEVAAGGAHRRRGGPVNEAQYRKTLPGAKAKTSRMRHAGRIDRDFSASLPGEDRAYGTGRILGVGL